MQPENHNNFLLENLQTKRLRFRKLSMDDFDAWSKLFVSVEVANFLGMDPKWSQLKQTQHWFDRTFHRYNNNLGSMNALIHKNTNELVGQSGLIIQTIDSEPRLEVTYSILPQYWRQGYAFEAANACLNHAFEREWASELVSIIDPQNKGSEKVALKNGMTLKKQIIEKNGATLNIFSIQREEWLKKKHRV